MKIIVLHSRSFQCGAALIVSLILLLVMTLLGVSAMQGTVLEEKMAGNFRDRELAFQAAEAALRDAEEDINSARISGLTGFDSDCTGGLCDATAGFSDVWKNESTKPNGVELGSYTGNKPLVGVACQPRYWIEGYRVWPPGSSSWKTRYRITAVACGGTSGTRVVLQEVYRP